MLDRKLHEKQIKAKGKTFNEKVNAVFSDNKILNDSIHYICIAAISIDYFMKIDKDYPQVYLQEWKYKIKKNQVH